VPDRTIRERARKSEKLAALTAEAERLWWRLVTMADDLGRIKDNAVLILSEAFPLMADRISVEQVDGWLSELAGVGLVKRYSADGQRVVWLIRWTQHQEIAQPNPSELPGPERIRPDRIVSAPRVTGARIGVQARVTRTPGTRVTSIASNSHLSTGTTPVVSTGTATTGTLLLPGIDTPERQGGPERGYGGKPNELSYRYDKVDIEPPEALRPFDTMLRDGLGGRYTPTTKFYARIRDYADIPGIDLEYQAEGMVHWLTTQSKGKKYTDIPRFVDNWLSKAAEDAVRRNRLKPGRNGYTSAQNSTGRPFAMGGPVSDETLESARRATERSRELGD
jgi:hypothetical protein